jgi:hypothetical protein
LATAATNGVVVVWDLNRVSAGSKAGAGMLGACGEPESDSDSIRHFGFLRLQRARSRNTVAQRIDYVGISPIPIS